MLAAVWLGDQYFLCQHQRTPKHHPIITETQCQGLPYLGEKKSLCTICSFPVENLSATAPPLSTTCCFSPRPPHLAPLKYVRADVSKDTVIGLLSQIRQWIGEGAAGAP